MLIKQILNFSVTVVLVLFFMICPAWSAGHDLAYIRESGVLRHLGVPYAHFIIDSETGLDVEIMRGFAAYLGVEYRFVKSDWNYLLADLTGRRVKPIGSSVRELGAARIRGDIIASGLTVLKWRQKIVNYSVPTFPTQVWGIVRADFPADSVWSGSDDDDIQAVKSLLKGRRVMGKDGTCLDPALYGLDEIRAKVFNFPGSLNDIAPAVIRGDADIALLDVPDTLVALEKWPDKFKVLGPLSHKQVMGAAFRKDSPELLKAFNRYFKMLQQSGQYRRLVEKYYPPVFGYFHNFFEQQR